MLGSARFTRRRTSRPSISGILMSRMTTSGRTWASMFSAARPLSAVVIWYAGLSSMRSDSRGPSSSSTTRMRAAPRGGSDVDEAFLHHLEGIEQPLQLVGGDGGRARADENPHVVAAAGLGVTADGQRDLREVVGRVVRQVTDQVRECLAKLGRVNFHRKRLRGRRDIELEVLAEAAVSEV